MLHAGFIVHHDIGIMALQLLYLGLHDSVHEAVASLPLGTAHHHQIVIVLLRQRIRQTALQIGGFGDARRNLILRIDTGPLDLLPELSQRHSRFHSQHFVEIRVRIRVHGQHRLLSAFAEILNQQAAQRRLSHSAFSCYCNNVSHNNLLYTSSVYEQCVDFSFKFIIIELYSISIIRFRKLYGS